MHILYLLSKRWELLINYLLLTMLERETYLPTQNLMTKRLIWATSNLK